MPFQVGGFMGHRLTEHLDAVRAAVATRDDVSGATVERDARLGTVTVNFDIANDDHKAVMRLAIRVVTSAVVAAGPDAVWRQWQHDGPTRITAN
ncbi:MAG TPA: hypothetical protein VHX38_11675 [Pseudonocardiaceae bacterium]|jgi:hypothetical protein|nr:hypothetical protein [Pseudonocardiaceae bacterium]